MIIQKKFFVLVNLNRKSIYQRNNSNSKIFGFSNFHQKEEKKRKNGDGMGFLKFIFKALCSCQTNKKYFKTCLLFYN